MRLSFILNSVISYLCSFIILATFSDLIFKVTVEIVLSIGNVTLPGKL